MITSEQNQKLLRYVGDRNTRKLLHAILEPDEPEREETE